MSEPPAPVVYARKSVPVIESLIEPEAYQPQQDDAAAPNADFTPLTPISFEFATPLPPPPQQGAISNGLDNSSGTEERDDLDDEDEEEDDDEEDETEIDSRILNAALTGSFHKDRTSSYSYNTLAMKSAAGNKKAVKLTNGQHEGVAKKHGRGRPCLPPGAAKQRTPRKPNKFFCEDCPRSFPTKEKFDAHCASHSADKYECECCDKVFRLKTTLKQHEMLHKTGTEPFLCRKCSRTFILKQSWHTHVKSCDGVIMNEGSLNDGKRRSSSFAGRKPLPPPPLTPSPGITAQKSGEQNGEQLLPIKKRGRPPLIKQQQESQQNTTAPIKPDIKQEIPVAEDVFFEVIDSKTPPPITPAAVVAVAPPPPEDKPKKEEVVKEIPVAKEKIAAVVKIEKAEKTKQVQKVKAIQEMSQPDTSGSEGRSQRKRNPPKWMTEEDMVMDYDGNNKSERFASPSNKQQQIKSPEPVKKAEQLPPPPPKLAPKPTTAINSPAVATRKSRMIPPLPELISAVQIPKAVVAAKVVQKTSVPLPPRNPSGRFLKTKSALEQKNETEDVKVVQPPVLESTRKSQRNILAQEKKPVDDKKINEAKGESVPRVLLSRFTPQRPQVKVADVPVEEEEPMEIETEEASSANAVSTNTEITEMKKDEESAMATEETKLKTPEKVAQPAQIQADIPKIDTKEDVVEESETQPKEKLLKKEAKALFSLPPLIPLIPLSPSGLATRKRKYDTPSPSKSNDNVTPNEPAATTPTTNGVNESPDLKRSRQSTPKKTTQPPKIEIQLATEENNICAKINDNDSTLQVNGIETSESGSNKTFAGMPKLLNQSGLSVVNDETDNSSDDEFDPSQGGEQSGSELYIKDTVMRFLTNKISNRNMLRIRQELLNLKQSGNYFKLTKTAPMAAGLVHDMFCGVFSSSSSNESNN